MTAEVNPSVQAIDLLAALESLPTGLPPLPRLPDSADGRTADRSSDGDTPKSASTEATNKETSGAASADIVLAGSVPAPRSTQDYQKLYTQCSAMGKKLKHSADAKLKQQPSQQTTALCLLEHADSLLLYLYAFWCQDYAHGSTENDGKIKPSIHLDSWKTSLGLLAYVKRRAQSLEWKFLVAICDICEAMVVNRMSSAERRSITKSLQSNENNKDSNNNNDRSIKTLLYIGTKVENAHKSFKDGNSVLNVQTISNHFPKTWRLCSIDNSKVGLDEWMILTRPFIFHWPPDIGAIGHMIGFAKALLEEWAELHNIDWTSWVVGPTSTSTPSPSTLSTPR